MFLYIRFFVPPAQRDFRSINYNFSPQFFNRFSNTPVPRPSVRDRTPRRTTSVLRSITPFARSRGLSRTRLDSTDISPPPRPRARWTNSTRRSSASPSNSTGTTGSRAAPDRSSVCCRTGTMRLGLPQLRERICTPLRLKTTPFSPVGV